MRTLTDHNISGRVLLHCDLDELKKLSGMTFGDWELFRIAILSLRDREMNPRPAPSPPLHSALQTGVNPSQFFRRFRLPYLEKQQCTEHYIPGLSERRYFSISVVTLQPNAHRVISAMQVRLPKRIQRQPLPNS